MILQGRGHLIWLVLALGVASFCGCLTTERPAANNVPPYCGVLVTAEMVCDTNLKSWRGERLNVVLAIENGSPEDLQKQTDAARRLIDAGFETEYWIEVARSPSMADAHPEWMSSLQGHDEWRRMFPDLKPAMPDEVVKNYPWVPILYTESFAAHLERIEHLLRDLPMPKRIWLNDLQGGPSACGCGHRLCRWTADYGPIHTATPLGDDAAADFVRAVAEKFPAAEIIPIWATECEEADEHESCGGVGCFDGICWQAYTRQLMHLEKVAPRIGVQCFYKVFERDLPRYGGRAGWIQFALRSFQEMPPQRGGRAIPANRLIAVVQGWDVDDAEQQSQIKFAAQAGATGYLIAKFPIAQGWEPRPISIAQLKK